MRRKTKTNRDRDLHARFFPRFEQVTWNLDRLNSLRCLRLLCSADVIALVFVLQHINCKPHLLTSEIVWR